ncbi:MAG: phage holin family protein [Bacteroidaceae bacterium]|nr:phage holin family protein [Bacteroidaceae bacterium]
MSGEIRNLFSELKNYLRLERRFVMLSVAEKVTVILSMLIIVAVLLVLASIIVVFLLVGLAHYIGSVIGNVAMGYALVALCAFVLLCVFYAFRTTLVVNPLARFMCNLFASTEDTVKP